MFFQMLRALNENFLRNISQGLTETETRVKKCFLRTTRGLIETETRVKKIYFLRTTRICPTITA